MKGIRSTENQKFLEFFSKVQGKSMERGNIFFLDTGECLDIEFNNMEVDNLCGWEVPLEISESFESKYLNKEILDEYSDYYIWIIPKIENDELVINFVSYD